MAHVEPEGTLQSNAKGSVTVRIHETCRWCHMDPGTVAPGTVARGVGQIHWQEPLAEPGGVNVLHLVTVGIVGPPSLEPHRPYGPSQSREDPEEEGAHSHHVVSSSRCAIRWV